MPRRARLAVVVLALIAALATPAPAPATTTLTGEVSRVVDGDTVKVVSRGFETTVRLIGVDAPETRHPSKPVQCFGPQATRRARSLLPAGAAVRLVTDDTQDVRDRYGRLLAYVYRAGRSESVNRVLVRTGAARVYVYGGVRFRHATSFLRAQSRARRAGHGLWGPPCRGRTVLPAPRRAAAEGAGGRCDPNYAGACVPVVSHDLDCADIGARVRVVGTDRHRLDGDGDGWGCESS